MDTDGKAEGCDRDDRGRFRTAAARLLERLRANEHLAASLMGCSVEVLRALVGQQPAAHPRQE